MTVAAQTVLPASGSPIVETRGPGEPSGFLGTAGWRPERQVLVQRPVRHDAAGVSLELAPSETRFLRRGQQLRLSIDGSPVGICFAVPRRSWVLPAVAAALLLLAGAGLAWWFGPRLLPDPLAQAYEQGLAALHAGDCVRAAEQLGIAVQGHYPPALLVWAHEQDSANFRACLVATPNDPQALRLYGELCEAGVPGARDAVIELERVLNQRKATGDVVATEVLRLMVLPVLEKCGL